MLLEIRNINIESIDMDEAVASLAQAKAVKREYEEQMIPMPVWLVGRIEELDREVKSRKRDYLQRALASAKARKESFKSREQKAADTEAEIARLEAELLK